MPTYDYKCNGCNHSFEAFQSINEDPIRICPKCGQEKVQRLISAGAGLIFKGSGFYITDHRSESYKRDARKDCSNSTLGSKTSSPSGTTSGKK